MTGTSEDLAVAGRTMAFRQGRVSSGCLSCALGPACLSRHVRLEKVALAGRGGSA